MRKKFKIIFLFFFFNLTACSHLKRSSEKRQQAPPVVVKSEQTTTPNVAPPVSGESITQPLTSNEERETTVEDDSSQDIEVNKPPVMQTQSIPRLGIILGPGGARAWGHIGFLHSLSKEKIPVAAIAGIEWGAMAAGYYSLRGMSNEVEWQMMKIKTDQSLDQNLRQTFAQARTETAKVPFACAANNLMKSQIYVMSKGPFSQLMPYCLSYPPHFKAWQGNVSAVRETKFLVDFLRKQGATHVIFVNVLPAPRLDRATLGEPGSTESILWNEVAAHYTKSQPGIFMNITLTLPEKSITEFDARREFMQKGAESAQSSLRELSRKLGL